MALELTHSALLIHDDIMDGDELRRGRPSFHRQYSELAGPQTDDAYRFGINMALAAGDAAIFLGVELLAKSQASQREGAAAYSLFVDQMLRTSAGQMQDVYLERAGEKLSKKAIYELMKTKTAAYTLALPLTMGAALAGQPPAQLRLLQTIGTAGGTIFQIRDDELGIMGDPELTGKPVGSDIKEGKTTLLYYYLIKSCTPPERRRLSAIFGNRAIGRDDIEYVRDLVKKHRIDKSLIPEIERLREKAYGVIDKLALDPQNRNEIKQLIDFCAQRQL
jgi:geranylgeranyl diphosphate synthase type I